MSKIICEICGTAYPDTAKECPICGFPHGKVDVDLDLNLDDLQMPEEQEAEVASVSQKVKGGRFSNRNVKKRHEEEAETGSYAGLPQQEDEPDQDGGNSGKGLKIAIAVLLVLVIAVGGYIVYRFAAGADAYRKPTEPTETTAAAEATESETTTAPTTEPTEVKIPCTDMKISNEALEIRSAGRGWMLDVSVYPEDTTDGILFSSSDPSVADVSSNGRITAVGPGEAVITITCGDITRECVVTCDFSDETTETTEVPETTEKPTEKPTEPETKPEKKGFRLDRTDVTLFKKGESFRFGVSDNGKVLSTVQVAWESSDPSVAKVENGTVTAVGGGTCTITATYNGQTQKCIVRCRIEKEPEETSKPTEPAVKPTEPTKPGESAWKISHSDVTLKVGESFSLRLSNGTKSASVTWTASQSGIVDISGSTITGAAAGTVTVSTTYEGQTYSCVVRVR